MAKTNSPSPSPEAPEAPAEIVTEVQEKPLAIDPTIEQVETVKAIATRESAKEAKLAVEAVVSAKAKAMKGLAAENLRGKPAVVESEELIAAVLADAEARDKAFEVDQITGVLVVR